MYQRVYGQLYNRLFGPTCPQPLLGVLLLLVRLHRHYFTGVYPLCSSINERGVFKPMEYCQWCDLFLGEESNPCTLHHRTPTHAGGLFAVTRKHFFDIGGYDESLLIWGAEGFQLSFKVSEETRVSEKSRVPSWGGGGGTRWREGTFVA